MPSPATVDEFLELVQRSGIADEARLKSYLQKLASQSGVPTDPSKLAGTLVRDGLLTYFQADQLLQGKWKRFFIGKYKVLERLGAGGMGQVFLCEHKLMRRRVAVKVLPAVKAQDPASLERFYREARAVAALDHPNIVRAYDIDQDDSLHFLVMEYVDGTNLQDLVKKNGPLDYIRACHYIYGTAVGLQHAHEMGLVHRDIKPGNILVDRSGVVKILDMGLARFFNDEDDSLTKKYDESILGTADYLAPEQALDSHSVDIRADIYSLGATFYFLLTGQPPFPEGTVAQKLLWHQTRHPTPVYTLRPDAPPELIEIINRMMEKDLYRRYQTPAELMAALAQWVLTPIPPPTDRELPQLSPAAMSAAAAKAFQSSGGSHYPDPGSHPGGSHPGVSPGSGAKAQPAAMGEGHSTSVMAGTSYPVSEPRTEPSRGAARPYPTPYPDTRQALPSPTSFVPGSPVHYTPIETSRPGQWPPMAAETRADDYPVTTSPYDHLEDVEPQTARPFEAPPPGRRKLLLWGAAATVVLVGAGAGLAVFLTRGTPVNATGPKHWYVTKSGTSPDPERTLTTLRGAVEQVGPDEVIVLLDDQIEDAPLQISTRLNKSLRNIRIEAGNAAKSVTWIPKVTPGGSPRNAVLEVQDVEGFKISGLVIEPGDGALSGIAVSGGSSGTEIDNITVRNARHSGFRFINLLTDPARPVVLTNFRSIAKTVTDPSNYAGVAVQGPERASSRALVVQNGILVGTAGTGLRVQGTVDVEFRNNRLEGFDTGVQWNGRGSDVPFSLTIANNTFHSIAKFGVQLDSQLANSKQTLTVTRNLFCRVSGDLLQIPGGNVTASDNARDKTSPDSRLNPKAVVVDVELTGKPEEPNFLLTPFGSEAAKFGAKRM